MSRCRVKSNAHPKLRIGVLLFLSFSLLMNFFACQKPSVSSDRPLVVTTIFPPYDFAKNIGGENAEVKFLVDVTDSHSYSPTAMDMLAIEECDIFIYTGGEGDRWAEDFLETIDCSHKIVLNMLEIADAVTEEIVEGMLPEEEEDEGPVYDEHVWLSPKNALKITDSICAALSKVKPDCTEAYQSNAAAYKNQLCELDEELTALCRSAERRTILVADRFPFRYLCEDYGLDYYAALPGCSSASDLTAIQYEFLADKLRENDLPVILTAEYSDRTIARTVLRESGIQDVEICTLHSCHTLTSGQIAKGSSYLSLMRENIAVLKKALN